MIKNIINIIHTKIGQLVMSIILGLGLSTLFRKSCENRDCIIFRAPSIKILRENTYKYNNKCYNFKETAMKCGMASKKIEFE